MLLNKKDLDILGEFARDYSGKIYGRDIAKKLRINQKTVSNILSMLEKEHILKFSQEGRNKYYFLNRFNPNAKEVIKMMEISRKIKFIERNNKLTELFNKLEERAKGIMIIFGSYAKNENTEKSDLDIFVIGNIREVEDLEKLYNIKINIVKSSKEDFDKNENIIKEVIKNHIILKGVEEVVELIW